MHDQKSRLLSIPQQVFQFVHKIDAHAEFDGEVDDAKHEDHGDDIAQEALKAPEKGEAGEDAAPRGGGAPRAVPQILPEARCVLGGLGRDVC